MNDLKTLYNARSNKDELAEVAEKLGIEDKSLAGILNELAEAGSPAPLILKGKVVEENDESSFVPARDFPTSAEIIAAYNSGRPVYQKVNYDNNEGIVFSPVAVFYSISEDEYFVNFTYDGTSCMYQLD